MVRQLLVSQYFIFLPITFHPGLGNQWTQGTEVLSRLRRPIKAIPRPCRAAESLCVFEDSVAVSIRARVLALSFKISARHADRYDFVPSDAAGENFISARLGGEKTYAVGPGEWDRERARIGSK